MSIEVPSRVPSDLFPYILIASVTSIYPTCLIAVNGLCRLEGFTLTNTKFVRGYLEEIFSDC